MCLRSTQETKVDGILNKTAGKYKKNIEEKYRENELTQVLAYQIRKRGDACKTSEDKYEKGK